MLPQLRPPAANPMSLAEPIPFQRDEQADSLFVAWKAASDDVEKAFKEFQQASQRERGAWAKFEAIRINCRMRLSHMQRVVFELRFQGLSNGEIASQLRIEERTVKFHVEQILAKVNMRGNKLTPELLDNICRKLGMERLNATEGS